MLLHEANHPPPTQQPFPANERTERLHPGSHLHTLPPISQAGLHLQIESKFPE